MLSHRLARFADASVLVIGDIILDHYLWGSASRISPEAPVPVVNVQREDLRLGGAANVLRNIVSLGGSGALCGVIGQDAMGRQAVDLVTQLGVSTEGLIVGQRPTTVKTRVVAQGQQIVRFDREQTGHLSSASLQGMLTYLENSLHQFDAVILSDYAKGVIGEQLTQPLQRMLASVNQGRQRKLPVIVDPKPVNIRCFAGTTVVTPNHHEAMQIAGLRIEDTESLREAAIRIRTIVDCESVLITRGEAGMALLEDNNPLVTIPTMAKEVYDVTGAGDTVAATLSLGLASGCTMQEAAILANHAAGIAVGKIGTACVSAQELLAAVAGEETSAKMAGAQK